MMRHAAVIVAAALLLAGCTLAPEPVPSPTQTSSPTPTTAVLPEPEHGVVGTGTLDGVSFEIVWDGSAFLLTGFENVQSGLVQISSELGVVGECIGDFLPVFDLPSPVPLRIAEATATRDATFIKSVSIVGEYTNDCYAYPVLSTAPIVWSMQPLYPDLVIVDSGETGGAKGFTTLEGDVPITYLVNQGDVLEEIAARFGLTPDQLRWLNPRRQNPDFVYKDETLNLSPTRR